MLLARRASEMGRSGTLGSASHSICPCSWFGGSGSPGLQSLFHLLYLQEIQTRAQSGKEAKQNISGSRVSVWVPALREPENVRAGSLSWRVCTAAGSAVSGSPAAGTQVRSFPFQGLSSTSPASGVLFIREPFRFLLITFFSYFLLISKDIWIKYPYS